MANRAMQAKVERSATQARELTAYDYLKYQGPKITSAELAELCENVPVKRVTKNRVVVSKLVYDRKLHSVTRVVSNCGYAYGGRTFNKRAGTCERALWIGKPPRM